MPPRPRYDGFIHIDSKVLPICHIGVQIALVGFLTRAIAYGNPNHKDNVPALFMHENLDLGPAAQCPLGFAGRALFLFEQIFVDDGPICRLILEHQHSPFV